jgi:hypothetical protein
VSLYRTAVASEQCLTNTVRKLRKVILRGAGPVTSFSPPNERVLIPHINAENYTVDIVTGTRSRRGTYRNHGTWQTEEQEQRTIHHTPSPSVQLACYDTHAVQGRWM